MMARVRSNINQQYRRVPSHRVSTDVHNAPSGFAPRSTAPCRVAAILVPQLASARSTHESCGPPIDDRAEASRESTIGTPQVIPSALTTEQCDVATGTMATMHLPKISTHADLSRRTIAAQSQQSLDEPYDSRHHLALRAGEQSASCLERHPAPTSNRARRALRRLTIGERHPSPRYAQPSTTLPCGRSPATSHPDRITQRRAISTQRS
jgi:hypothetical protein